MSVEVFALLPERSHLAIGRFLEVYARNDPRQLDFTYPAHGQTPTHTFQTFEELLDFLVRTPDTEYALYWDGRGSYCDVAALFFLADGGVIVDCCVGDLRKDELREALADLIQVTGALGGYVDVEGPAPSTAKEFWHWLDRADVNMRANTHTR